MIIVRCHQCGDKIGCISEAMTIVITCGICQQMFEDCLIEKDKVHFNSRNDSVCMNCFTNVLKRSEK